MLAVTSENDVILLDPWHSDLIHVFSGRGGHLSSVNQVLFSEDDRMLLSASAAPTGAIYGWELETESKERKFEHVAKGNSYTCLAHDFQKELVVACAKPEGNIHIVSDMSHTFLELVPEHRDNCYTYLCLCAPLDLLFAGSQRGYVYIFRWPVADNTAKPFIEVALHAHSISCLSVGINAHLLFSGCEGGTVMASELMHASSSGSSPLLTSLLIDKRIVLYRHMHDRSVLRRRSRQAERKVVGIERRLFEAGLVTSATTKLDDLVMVPKAHFTECFDEIKNLEERMGLANHVYNNTLEKKEQDIHEQLQKIAGDRKHEKEKGEEKYEDLFGQLVKATERQKDELRKHNAEFDQQTRDMQEQYRSDLSEEFRKQKGLLWDLQNLRDQHEVEVRSIVQKSKEEREDQQRHQEKDIREWKEQYDHVCNLLKTDGLKFEAALNGQESEYEEQITEILEQRKKALQVESEKSETALKDGVSMKQTLNMLDKQLKLKDEELRHSQQKQDDLRKKLDASLKTIQEVQDQLKERERGLKVKDESLFKMREQMKHLESFRFVLFNKVKNLEDERDPLEEQVSSLKSSVREMYGEFVREFRQKQQLDQQLDDKNVMSVTLQKENVELRARQAQLKKDARHLVQDVESVLHAEVTQDFEQMPRRLESLLSKHGKLKDWAPPASDKDPDYAPEDTTKESSMIEEMVIQRNLQFRKTKLAQASAERVKRECTQDLRRLTSENAELIAQMNMIGSDKQDYRQKCQKYECKIMELKAKHMAALREARSKSSPSTLSGGMKRVESAPEMVSSSPTGRPGMRNVSSAGGQTPYVRRKVVEGRWQLQKQHNPPPLVGGGTNVPPSRLAKPSAQDQASTQNWEQQGFDVGKLSSAAQAGVAQTGAAHDEDAAASMANVVSDADADAVDSRVDEVGDDDEEPTSGSGGEDIQWPSPDDV